MAEYEWVELVQMIGDAMLLVGVLGAIGAITCMVVER